MSRSRHTLLARWPRLPSESHASGGRRRNGDPLAPLAAHRRSHRHRHPSHAKILLKLTARPLQKILLSQLSATYEKVTRALLVSAFQFLFFESGGAGEIRTPDKRFRKLLPQYSVGSRQDSLSCLYS